MSSRKASRLPSRTQESRLPTSSRDAPLAMKAPPSQTSSLFSRKMTERGHSDMRQPPASTSHFGFRSRAGSASSSDIPTPERGQRNVLRRKPSSNNQRAAFTQQTSVISAPSLLSASPEPSTVYTDTREEFPLVLGFSVSPPPPPPSASPARSFKRSEPPTNAEPYGLFSSYQLPTPQPPFHPGPSSSPATTRYSESPSPWSRTSTPTSMSSHSPGITMPSKFVSKPRQKSPTRSRPPVTRRRAGSMNQDDVSTTIDAHGLPSLRESVTSSSSSGSTLRAGEKKDQKRKKSKHRMTSPPHSPPPRTSSQKFNKTQMRETTYLADRQPTVPVLPDMPPPRPSREGTPRLDDRSALPVIQSNLTGFQSMPGHRRNRSSSSYGDAATISDGNGLRLVTSRIPSRTVSPSPTQLSARSDTLPPSSLGKVPDLRPDESKRSKKVAASPKTASPNKTPTSRFGFFSRKPKATTEDATTKTSSEKATKKGPIAGTGHEGYGKYAMRGRSGSQTNSSGVRTRSTSTGTNDSINQKGRKGSVSKVKEGEVDDFLRDRLDPVVIPGGGGTPASSLFGAEMSRTGSNQSSQPSRPSFDSKLNSSQVSVNSKHSNELPRPTFGFFNASRLSPSSSRRPSTSSESESKPSIAMRRSLHRSEVDAQPLALPQSINIDTQTRSPSIGTATTFDTDLSEGKEGSWLRPKRTEKVGKSPRKWNFFQRTHNISTKVTPQMTEVSVTIARHQAPKSMAHYAIMDSGDQENSEDLSHIVREARDGQLTPSSIDSQSEAGSPVTSSRPPEAYSILLPDPPMIPSSLQNSRPSSPKVMLRTEDSAPAKVSRLPQVGRIPRVVSTRQKTTTAEPSAPRAFPLVGAGKCATVKRDSGSDTAARPIPKRSNTGDSSTGPFDPKSFLTFPPRKASVVSCSSSGGHSPPAGATFDTVPQISTGEDEVWGEYDDLIDGMSPSSQDALASPFQYNQAGINWGIAIGDKPKVKESPVIGSDCGNSPALSPRLITMQNTHSGLPTTPLTLRDFLNNYGERNNNLDVRGSAITQFSMSDISRLSSASCYSRSQQDVAEEESMTSAAIATDTSESTSGHVNVRFGALMTSKWLSFGRVLFSPVHAEIHQMQAANKQDRILILDGLRNDDWSFYCALTYPNATVYNLSPQQSSSTPTQSQRDPGAWRPPPNHRQTQHPDISNPFPFPRGFFTAVIYRFPIVTCESTYRFVVSECKRVLRPGGFLELSVLDLDMMNMGPRTRRALMALKCKLQASDPDVSLKSTSDSIQRLLGRRGFENLNRCNVGVPAAGSLAAQSPVGSAMGGSSADLAQNSMSLTALLSDQSREGDEGITNMVAKVGRWWYSRCFESGLAGNESGDILPQDSIWADRAVLRECEAKKTSFKLLICYAQKPLVPRRRTVSL